jgi:XTP/dITP diphosphohydrolase
MKIVLASDNAGKIKEFQAILKSLPITLLSQKEFAVPTIPETGLSFIENALIKARHAAKITKLPALADDSGLTVQALKGAPGIYSARYAGENANDKENIQKLLQETQGVADNHRQAAFYCALAFVRYYDDPVPLICQGKWEGVLLRAPQGNNGFGYDPIFYVSEHQCSAAELPSEIKNQISHRAKALAEFMKQFIQNLHPN